MRTVFFTGAGISAAAGIPTYRDKGSSWTDPNFEAKSHANRYGNHLDELWDGFWGPVGTQMDTAEPTYAHKRIAENGGVVITQNIDQLHEIAGSETVYHLHGDNTARCLRCKGTAVEAWAYEGAPKCKGCGSTKTRPNVVLFGESLSKRMFREIAQHMTLDTERFVVVGSSLNVHPATGIVMDALSSRLETIIINRDRTSLTPFFKRAYFGNADDLIDKALE